MKISQNSFISIGLAAVDSQTALIQDLAAKIEALEAA